jgi:hypothetical protein
MSFTSNLIRRRLKICSFATCQVLLILKRAKVFSFNQLKIIIPSFSKIYVMKTLGRNKSAKDCLRYQVIRITYGIRVKIRIKISYSHQRKLRNNQSSKMLLKTFFNRIKNSKKKNIEEDNHPTLTCSMIQSDTRKPSRKLWAKTKTISLVQLPKVS